MLHQWPPQEDEGLIFLHLGSDLVIYSSYEHCFKSHIGIDGCICLSVSEFIEQECNLWADAEFSFQETMSDVQIVDDVLVIGAGFIICAPSTLSDLKLSILDQLLYNVLCWLFLSCIPHVEKLHLNDGESPIRILLKMENNLFQNLR